MNKKGEEFAPSLIFYSIFALFVLAVMFFILAWIFNREINHYTYVSEEFDYMLYGNIFLDTPRCFAYQLPGGSVVQNTVDYSKITNKQFETCYAVNKDKKPAFRVRVLIDGETVPRRAESSGFNPNLGYKQIIQREVFIYDNNILKTGKVTVDMQDEN